MSGLKARNFLCLQEDCKHRAVEMAQQMKGLTSRAPPLWVAIVPLHECPHKSTLLRTQHTSECKKKKTIKNVIAQTFAAF